MRRSSGRIRAPATVSQCGNGTYRVLENKVNDNRDQAIHAASVSRVARSLMLVSMGGCSLSSTVSLSRSACRCICTCLRHLMLPVSDCDDVVSRASIRQQDDASNTEFLWR